LVGITIHTIGHSNHSFARFVELLRQHDVAVVADVRSQPYSKWAPQYRKETLASALQDEGFQYLFFGRELGGRPEDPEVYDEDGNLDHDRRAQAPDFRMGIQQLIAAADKGTMALLCAEENPEHCHRHLLVRPALEQRGVEVLHIRGDGRTLRADKLESAQMSLFG
jgi:uncharacterized protein (DUF488 family)